MLKQCLSALLIGCSVCAAAESPHQKYYYGEVIQAQWHPTENKLRYMTRTPEGMKAAMVDVDRKAKRLMDPPQQGDMQGKDAQAMQKAKEQAMQKARAQQAGANRQGPEQRGQKIEEGKLFIRDHQVFLRREGKDIQLSWDGNPTDSYTPQIMYSPQGDYAIVMRKHQAATRETAMLETAPKSQLQPIVHKRQAPRAGDDNTFAYPMLFSVKEGRQIALDYSAYTLPFAFSNMRWDKDNEHFTFEYNRRGHQHYALVSVEAATGKMTNCIDETSPTFIFFPQQWRYHLEKSDEVLWISERDGWKHLYLFDASQSNHIKAQITQGEWIVKEVLHVDEDKGHIYFLGAGYYPEENPYYTHLFKVNFDGSGLQDLSPEKGNHTITLSNNKQYFIDSCSTTEKEAITQIRSLEDGALIMPLEKGDASAAEEQGWIRPQAFCTKGRDGKTDIYGNIYLPKNYDPNKKYPVLESIYAGPQDSFVNHHFHISQSIIPLFTEKGYIVVNIDGMGTYNRSKAFHNVCWQNLQDAGLPDRIAWIKEAAKIHPSMDLTRVGLFGCSSGGQNTMTAMLFHNNFYKAGVAACGSHDCRLCGIWGGEMWLGYPVNQSYIDCSNVEHAHRLEGNLLLIVGEMDTTVDPVNTMQAADALIKADKYFELLVVPGAGHSYGGEYGFKRMLDFFERSFKSEPIPFKEL